MIGMNFNMLPISPFRNASEPNTKTVVRNDDITPGATCLVPSTAAFRGGDPARIWAAMFSDMTMASSTSSPMPISMPTMVIISNDSPVSAMAAMAPKNDTGKPIATQKEKRALKNSQRVIITKISPCQPFLMSSDSRSSTIEEISRVMVKRTPGGARRRCTSRNSLTAPITLRVSWLRVLEISKMAARLPLKTTRLSARSNISVILAMSPSLISAPELEPTTTRSRNSNGLRRASSKRTKISLSVVSMVPAGRSKLCRAMMAAMSSTLMPYWRKVWAGTSMRI